MSSSSRSSSSSPLPPAPVARYGSGGGSAKKRRSNTELLFGSPLLPDKRPKLGGTDESFDAILFAEDEDGSRTPVGRDAFIQSVAVHHESRHVEATALTPEDVLDDDAVVVVTASSAERYLTPPRKTYQKKKKKKKMKKTPVSEIRTERVRNLGKRSNSQLLLDVLLRRPSGQMRELERSVLGETGWTSRKAFDEVMAQGLRGVVGTVTNDLMKLVRHLLAQGADPNHSDADGRFPLQVAVQYEHCDQLVRVLLDEHAHADEWVRRPGRRSLTLVDVALHLGHAGAVRMLLEAGACVTATRPMPVGESVLAFAKLHGFEKVAVEALAKRFWRAVVKRPHNEETVRSIIYHGMPVDVPAKNGMTPLYFLVKDTAQCSENLPLIRFLLDHGANPLRRDKQNVPMSVFPAQSAVKGAVDVVALLEEYS